MVLLWVILKVYLGITGVFFPVMIYFHYWGNPIQFPIPPSPWGHAHFGLVNAQALSVLQRIVVETTGKSFRFTWQDEDQMLASFLRDSLTAFCCIDERSKKLGLTGTGRSFPVRDPKLAAERAAQMLEGAGYSAQIIDNFLPH